MARRPKPPRPLVVEDVLAGRGRPALVDLLALIHEVNPTGSGQPEPQQARRYRQKSQLQSLLIAEYGESITVVPDPDRQGVVLLRAESIHLDGCHAVIDELSEHARSWVNRKLDLAGEADVAAVSASRRSANPGRGADRTIGSDSLAAAPASTLLEQGHTALASYDYEQARHAFEQALDAEPSAAAAATALLALLVDHLAADDEALRIAASMGTATEAPDVRMLLAVAAARQGDRSQALRWARGLQHPRVDDVLTELAHRALAGADLKEAASMLAQLRARSPAHPGVVELTDLISRAQEERRAPLEAKLAELVAADCFAEAEPLAAAILADHPDSRAAQMVQKEAGARRAREAALRLAAQAREEAARDDLPAAIALMRRAAREGLEGAELEDASAALYRWEALHARRESERSIDATLAALREDLGEGLTRYLGLAAAEREAVRCAARVGELEWLEDMHLGSSKQAIREGVDAVRAASKAAPLRDSDPARFLASMAEWEQALSPVPSIRRWLREARESVAARQKAEAHASLEQARKALDAGEPTAAIALIEALRPGDVDKDLAAEIGVVRKAARLRLLRREAEQRLDRLEAREAWLDARDLATQLASEPDAEGRDELRARAARAQEHVQRSFDVRVLVGGAPDPLIDLEQDVGGSSRPFALTVDGTRLVAVQALLGLVFVRVIDVRTERVVERLRLVTPENLDECTVTVDAERCWIVGARGAVLCLELSGWHVLRWVGVTHTPLERVFVERALLEPASGCLWVESRARTGLPLVTALAVHDISRGGPARAIGEGWGTSIIHSRDNPRVAYNRGVEGVAFCTPRGVSLPFESVPQLDTPEALTLHPDGAGIVAAGGARELDPADDESGERVLVACWDAHGRSTHTLTIAGASPDSGVALASVLGQQTLFALVVGEDDLELVGMHLEGAGELRIISRVHVGDGAVLVGDAWARHAVCLQLGRNGFSVVRADNAPSVRELSPRVRPLVPLSRGLDICAPSEAERTRKVDEMVARVPAGAGQLRHKWLQQLRDAAPDDPEHLVIVALALRKLAWANEAGSFFAWLSEQHQDHPGVRMLAASAAWENGAAAEVESWLAAVDAASLPRKSRRHYHHLRGAALALAGRHQEALTQLEAGKELEGSCRLDAWIQLLRSDDRGSALASHPSRARDPLDTLVSAIHESVALSSDGDHAGACSALDISEVWETRERQGLARAANSWLHRTELDEFGKYRKAMVLAAYCVVCQQDPDLTTELPVLRERLSEEELERIKQSALEWISSA